MTLRVAFVGASGTGKTVLMQHVAEKYKLPVCPIGSRTVAKEMGYENPYEVDKAGKRMEFQARLFTLKKAWEEEHENFVSDRSCFDNLTYTVIDGDTKQITPFQLGQYVEAIDRYTHVFFMPLRAFQNLGSDAHRVKNPAYHALYETLLQGLLEEHYTGLYYQLGIPAVRVEQVDDVLKYTRTRQ